MVGGLFQAYPGGGGTSQTAVNNEAGAKTQVAALATALTVALTLLVLAPLVSLIPEPALAALVLAAAAAAFAGSLALVPSLGVDLIPPFSQGEFSFKVQLPEGTPLEVTDRFVASLSDLLEEPRHADALKERGILYAPDFVFNSGALIAVTEEIAGFSIERAMRRAESIYLVLKRVFWVAHERGISTAEAANVLAEERIRQIGGLSGQARSRCGT